MLTSKKYLLQYILIASLISGMHSPTNAQNFSVRHDTTRQKPDCLICYENPLAIIDKDSCCAMKGTPSSIKDRLARRKANYDFFYTMRKIMEPATVSSFTTWTFNQTGYDKKNFVLDADVPMPITIGGKKFGLNVIQVIPHFKVRIFQNDPNVPFGTKGDISLPVRTPSTIAGLAYYRTFRGWWSDEDPTSFKEHLTHNKFFGIYAYHSSNGQDGDEIDTASPGEVNIYNGNFGENVIFDFILGGRMKNTSTMVSSMTRNQSKLSVNEAGKQVSLKLANRKEWYWKVTYEWHPKKLSNETFDSLRMMGRHRINVNVGLMLMPTLWELIGDGQSKWCSVVPEKSMERWRFTGNLNYILDPKYYRGNTFDLEKVKFLNASRRLNLWLTTYYIIGRSNHAAAFASAGYFGSDNYNIYFNQSLWHFKLGLAFGFFDQHQAED